MIEEVGREEVLEIWKVVDIRSEKRHNIHFVIIVNAVSYLCSCLKSISKGIICRHYFRVMMNSKIAAFHISMIPQRWYKDIYQDGSNLQENIISIHNNELTDEGIINLIKSKEIESEEEQEPEKPKISIFEAISSLDQIMVFIDNPPDSFTAEIKHIVALKSLKSQISSFHKNSKKQSSLDSWLNTKNM